MALYAKAFLVLVVALTLLVGTMVFRAEVYFPRPSNADQCNKTHTPIAGQDIIDRFAQALRFPTITRANQDYDGEPRVKFAEFLRKIKGSDATLKPYLLCSHIDVVPVELDQWDVDPFGGVVKDGYIYGRGAIDVKNTLMAIMESLEYLLKSGFKPKRSFYIAFGHDEEGQGSDGAAEIAKLLTARGIKEFEFLLDEGMVMFKDSFPGIKDLVAVVAVAEKGFVTLNVRTRGQVGHSSMAPVETAITKLGRAVSKLTGTSFPNLYGKGPENKMFESFAEYAEYPYKLVYSNLWFFGPLLARILSQKPSSNALIRTTSAVTQIKGGFKDNVLPSMAEAVVNHRVHPMQTIQDVIDYDKYLINDPNVEIEIKGESVEPHPISPYDSDSFGYQTIKKSISQVFEETIVIPGIFVATTDTRHYLKFTKSVYRFSPSIMMNEADTKRFHGHNERISVDNYLKTVNFYHHVLLNSDQSSLSHGRIFKDEL